MLLFIEFLTQTDYSKHLRTFTIQISNQMQQKKRLFLLDAYALIFRGYYAFIKNPRINSKGLDTSAIMGFMNSLLDVIKRERPNYLAVAFDKGGSAQRAQLYPAYKANRDTTPEAIKIAVPYIHEILRAMHIPIVEVAGYEADDLIGTLSKQAEKQGYQVFMVTPDKDYAQLVSENIFMYRPARMGNGIEIWGVDQVKEKFEVSHPEQVIDYLAMMGDAVDNIPGLVGVGEKTAKKFLAAFGSIENLLENTSKLKGKMKEKIEASKEQGLLSKELARILLDCPVQFKADEFAMSVPDIEKTREIFTNLEFRRMQEQFEKIFLNQTPASTSEIAENSENDNTHTNESTLDLFAVSAEDDSLFSSSSFQTEKTSSHLYQLIEDEVAEKLLLKNLLLQNQVSFKFLTQEIKNNSNQLIGIVFSYKKQTAFYLPLPLEKNNTYEVLQKFAPFFENDTIVKIGYNLKNECKLLKSFGIELKGELFDVMLAHYLINPDMRHNLDLLLETYLHYQPINLEELTGKKGKNQLLLHELSTETVLPYIGEQADLILQLKELLENQLKATETLQLYKTIESPLISVLASMESEGITLDISYLKHLSEQLAGEAKDLELKIIEQCGVEFNLASPKQLGEVLFETLKIGGAKPKKTKTGQYATSEDVLSTYADKHQIVADILEWRQIVKLQNTYVDALPLQADKQTHRIHTEYMQAVAATGRLSSNNPNLQNIPVRTQRGQKVRQAFIAKDENHILLAADYSQIELRIIAALSQEPNMMQSFKDKEDIHRSTAAKVFQVPLNEVTKEQRSHAKTVNFGIIYGVSAFGLSNQTTLSRAQSKELIETYYQTYPRLKNYIESQIEFARENGFVQTISGRRRYLKDIQSQNTVVRSAAERNAVNAPIQGSAADIIKLAMIAIDQKLRQENLETKMLLQVHDELIFEVPLTEIELVKDIIQQKMEHVCSLQVPLEVEIGQGNNWLQAH